MPVHSLSTSTNLVLQQKANNSRPYTDRKRKLKTKKQPSLITSKLFPGPRIACSLCRGMTKKKKKKANSHLRSHCHFVNQKHTQVRGTGVSLNDSSAIVLNYHEGSSFLPSFPLNLSAVHSVRWRGYRKTLPGRQGRE